MTELKAGTRGTVGKTTLGIRCEIVTDKPDGFGRIVIKHGDPEEFMIVFTDDFTPDPEPPTTVMVEMSVDMARKWRLINSCGDLSCGDYFCVTGRAAAKALREAGIS